MRILLMTLARSDDLKQRQTETWANVPRSVVKLCKLQPPTQLAPFTTFIKPTRIRDREIVPDKLI